MSAARWWNSFWEPLRLSEKQQQTLEYYFRAEFVAAVAVAEFGNGMAGLSGQRESESLVSPRVLAFECDVVSAVSGHLHGND